tara:strand:+ start:14 stop:250 length:237 start_codon:yes stop_codon:yes gene_type:complete
MKIQKITIKKINQNYLNNLVSVNKKIGSGRKNYQDHYNRILKNVILSKLFSKKIIPLKNNFKIINNKSYMSLISKIKI